MLRRVEEEDKPAVTTFEVREGSLSVVDTAASFTDASWRLPQGGYTTLRTYGTLRVLRLAQHLRRLEESLALMGRPATLDDDTVRKALAAALTATGHAESRIRLTWAPPQLFVSVEPFTPLPDALYRDGAACVTVPVHRDNPHSKDTRFIAAAAATYRDLPPGVEEGLMTGSDGAILEGLSSNFFAVLRGVLRTEEERALLGVTRSLVLDLALDVLPVSTVPVRVDDLSELGECFITSVSRAILPVVSIDGRRIGEGRPGPMTRTLREGFLALLESEAETLAQRSRRDPVQPSPAK